MPTASLKFSVLFQLVGVSLALPLISTSAEAETNYPIRDFSTLVSPSTTNKKFDGHIQFGYTSDTGSDSTATLNGSANLTWRRHKSSYNLYAYTYATGDDTSHSAERYVLAGRTRHDLDADSFLFSQIRLTIDRFSGYKNQLSLAGGYGRQLVKTPHQSLSWEIGPGIRRDELSNEDIHYRPLAYLGFDYQYNLSDHVTFEQNAGAEVAGNSIATHSDTSLNINLNKRFTLRLEYLIDYNGNPPANASYTTDTTEMVSLDYNF